MPRISCTLLALVLTAVVGCSTPAPEIRSDYETTANLSGLKDYAWMPGLQPPSQAAGMDSGWLDGRIRGAVDKELSGRGYHLVPGAAPDFLVAYHVALEKKLDVARIEHVYGYAARRGAPVTTELTREYDEGSLMIDVLGPKDRQLLWRGVARGRIKPGLSSQEREARIDETVRQIMENFARR
jgi:hypothetical protein